MSTFIRRTRMPLAEFVELVRGQTASDYRPNKARLPSVYRRCCGDYEHLDDLVSIAEAGVRVKLSSPLPPQTALPRNHPSASARINVLRANIRKEQDMFRYIVVDSDILDIWPEVFISPFGVVDKGDADPQTTGRVIHDLSYPEDGSVNACTDPDSIPKATFERCSSVAREIVRCRASKPNCAVKLMAGDVATAYRNAGTHSACVHMFAGRIPEDNAIIIDLAAAFGWSGSARSYGILGGAVAHLHGRTGNAAYPNGFYNYHWVDDHVSVASDFGTNCEDINRSLRWAMITTMGHAAVNEDKFSSWSTRLKVLGLIFDTVAGTVAIPEAKISKAKTLVAHAFSVVYLTRSEYRSLLGSLRHVASCVRPARVFLQRLRARERQLHRLHWVTLSTSMRCDLMWWWNILQFPMLNGVPLEYFDAQPAVDITVVTDASDEGLCAIVPSSQLFLTYQFSREEADHIAEFHAGTQNEFDINYRELLACALAVETWAPISQHDQAQASRIHVHFRIDNTTAVSWQTKMASRNSRAQVLVRLLGMWELQFGLRFSASHIPGVENTIADAGSRWWNSTAHACKFSELTSGWSQAPSPPPVSHLEEAWYNICEGTPLQSPPTILTPELSAIGRPGQPGVETIGISMGQ